MGQEESTRREFFACAMAFKNLISFNPPQKFRITINFLFEFEHSPFSSSSKFQWLLCAVYKSRLWSSLAPSFLPQSPSFWETSQGRPKMTGKSVRQHSVFTTRGGKPLHIAFVQQQRKLLLLLPARQRRKRESQSVSQQVSLFSQSDFSRQIEQFGCCCFCCSPPQIGAFFRVPK